MTYAEFHISLFQIADMWCDGVCADEYVALLELVLDAVSFQSDGGRRKFRAIEGAMCATAPCVTQTHRLGRSTCDRRYFTPQQRRGATQRCD